MVEGRPCHCNSNSVRRTLSSYVKMLCDIEERERAIDSTGRKGEFTSLIGVVGSRVRLGSW